VKAARIGNDEDSRPAESNPPGGCLPYSAGMETGLLNAWQNLPPLRPVRRMSGRTCWRENVPVGWPVASQIIRNFSGKAAGDSRFIHIRANSGEIMRDFLRFQGKLSAKIARFYQKCRRPGRTFPFLTFPVRNDI